MATYTTSKDGTITKKMASGATYAVAKSDPRYQRVANESVSNAAPKSVSSVAPKSVSNASSGSKSGSSGSNKSSSGISGATYDEIVRKAMAGIQLTDATPEKQSLYNAYASAYSGKSGGNTVTAELERKAALGIAPTSSANQAEYDNIVKNMGGSVTAGQTGVGTGLAGQTGTQITNPTMPYENDLRALLPSSPQTAPKSQAEILATAQNYASLNINPQLEALRRSIAEAGVNANNQTNTINAAYQGGQAQTQGMLDEARRYALESAIARGGGQSGVVNWETEKRTTPIMQQQQQADADQAAKISAVADWLANVQTQGATQEQDLAARQGDLTQQYSQLLADQGQANSVADWQRMWNSVNQLGSNVTQNQQFMVPYGATTEYQRQQLPLDWATAMGQVPGQTGGVGGYDPALMQQIANLMANRKY